MGRPRKYNSLIERAVGDAQRKWERAMADENMYRKEYDEMLDIKKRLEESYAAKPPPEDDQTEIVFDDKNDDE